MRLHRSVTVMRLWSGRAARRVHRMGPNDSVAQQPDVGTRALRSGQDARKPLLAERAGIWIALSDRRSCLARHWLQVGGFRRSRQVRSRRTSDASRRARRVRARWHIARRRGASPDSRLPRSAICVIRQSVLRSTRRPRADTRRLECHGSPTRGVRLEPAPGLRLRPRGGLIDSELDQLSMDRANRSGAIAWKASVFPYLLHERPRGCTRSAIHHTHGAATRRSSLRRLQPLSQDSFLPWRLQLRPRRCGADGRRHWLFQTRFARVVLRKLFLFSGWPPSVLSRLRRSRLASHMTAKLRALMRIRGRRASSSSRDACSTSFHRTGASWRGPLRHHRRRWCGSGRWSIKMNLHDGAQLWRPVSDLRLGLLPRARRQTFIASHRAQSAACAGHADRIGPFSYLVAAAPVETCGRDDLDGPARDAAALRSSAKSTSYQKRAGRHRAARGVCRRTRRLGRRASIGSRGATHPRQRLIAAGRLDERLVADTADEPGRLVRISTA